MSSKLKSYYYLTKPGIIYGNAINVVGGFFLASDRQVAWALLLYVLLGTSFVVASGCVINNYIDRGLDRKMNRTKQRALVTGSIGSTSALLFAAVLGLIGFFLLNRYTNSSVVYIGIFALLSYVVFYGIAKRKTVHGTLVGTLPGAAPPVAGYLAVRGHFDTGVLLLGLILIFWQMAHFYCIAMYRYSEYKAAGLPVWPIVKGNRSARIAIFGYILAFCISCILLSAFDYTGYVFVFVMMLASAAWFRNGIRKKAASNLAWGRTMFRQSLIIILILNVMLSIDSLIV